jgi:hypothetical protein
MTPQKAMIAQYGTAQTHSIPSATGYQSSRMNGENLLRWSTSKRFVFFRQRKPPNLWSESSLVFSAIHRA